MKILNYSNHKIHTDRSIIDLFYIRVIFSNVSQHIQQTATKN